MVNLPERTGLVAVVDDDPSVRVALQGVLKSVGLRVAPFSSAEEFLASAHLADSACLITDLQMPGMNGLQLQERLTEDGRDIPIIFITAYGDERVRAQAIEAGAIEFLYKPFDDDALIETVRAALRA